MNHYIFSVHRGGSCVVGDISKICADENSIPTNMIGTEQFEEVSPTGCAIRISHNKYRPIEGNWICRSGVFAPIRRPDFFPPSIIRDEDKLVLIIRDPRDCMVSGFFGFLKLHEGGLKNPDNLEKFNAGIDKYVLNDLLPMYKENYIGYIDLIEKCSINVLKYEEMVTDFSKWFVQFYSLAGFGSDNFQKCESMCTHFFSPVEEDENRHKRKMIPGDYLEKLHRETISQLDNELAFVLDYFEYSRS